MQSSPVIEVRQSAVDDMRAQLDAAINRCRKVFRGLPTTWIEANVQAIRDKLTATVVRGDNAVTKAAHLEVLQSFIPVFDDVTNRLGTLPDFQRRAAWNELQVPQRLGSAVASSHPSTPAFNPSAYARLLASRGITLSEGPDGKLRASPRDRLSDVDRSLLRSHRDSFLAVVNATSETF